MLARFISGLIADLAGWRAVYFVSSGLMLTLAAVLWKVVPATALPRSQDTYPALIRSLFKLFMTEPVLRIRGLLALLIFAAFSVLWTSMVLPLSAPPLLLSHTAIAFCGLLSIISIVDGTVTTAGLILVLLGAVAWSAANVINKKARTTQVFAFLVWSSAFSPLPLFALDYAVNGSTVYSALVNQLDYRAVLSILFQVYPNTLFGYWVWNSLLKRYPVSTVAPLSLLVPVFGLLGSVMIFNEPLSFNKIVAVVLIVSGLGVGLYGQRLLSAVLRRADRCPS